LNYIAAGKSFSPDQVIACFREGKSIDEIKKVVYASKGVTLSTGDIEGWIRECIVFDALEIHSWDQVSR